MMVMLVVAIFVAVPFEQRGGQVLRDTGVELSASADSAGGNMSDKEVRFGITDSALWGTVTTAASNGSVNSGHDAWTGAAAVVPLTLIGWGRWCPAASARGSTGCCCSSCSRCSWRA